MLCGWAGIGSVGLAAIGTLRRLVRASEFGRIEPYEYFEPSKVVIRDGLISRMWFPNTTFYSHSLPDRDLLLLVGEQQPTDDRKAYKMANEVLDVAQRVGCRRIYTSAASVTTIHHRVKPRVWAVPNSPDLLAEVRRYGNTILMSEAENAAETHGTTDESDEDTRSFISAGSGGGSISGLNGILLGAAKNRGIEAICLMGEVPYYLQAAPWPYPKASISVLEVLSRLLRMPLDLCELHEMAEKVDRNIEQVLEALANAEELPEQVRTEMERLKQGRRPDLGPITEGEKHEIMEHIDELFRDEAENGS
jgi:proteasome assembly chaperone (PAC2) family protein